MENLKLIFRRSRVLGELKQAGKRGLARASRFPVVRWLRRPLDRNETVSMLSGRVIGVADDGVLHLPQRESVNGGEIPSPFARRDVPLEPEYVWRLERVDFRSLTTTYAGGMLVDRKLLHTDFDVVQGFRPARRKRLAMDVAIAPWSHNWGTYYEFVVHIIGKLCRIRETVDPEVWESALICYPLRHASFECQYLSLLGVTDRVVDTRRYRVAPRSVIFGNVQSGDRLVPRSRLLALRRTYLGDGTAEEGGRRLYFSREEGLKRQVQNEDEVLDVVRAQGIEVVESMPESVEEQISLFSSASLVISAHGSALTNLVWCSPGTRVIELFTRSFVSDIYSAMSENLGLRHTYLVDDDPEPPHYTNLHKDLTVDIPALVAALEVPTG